jgi:hypothetical protein
MVKRHEIKCQHVWQYGPCVRAPESDVPSSLTIPFQRSTIRWADIHFLKELLHDHNDQPDVYKRMPWWAHNKCLLTGSS